VQRDVNQANDIARDPHPPRRVALQSRGRNPTNEQQVAIVDQWFGRSGINARYRPAERHSPNDPHVHDRARAGADIAAPLDLSGNPAVCRTTSTSTCSGGAGSSRQPHFLGCRRRQNCGDRRSFPITHSAEPGARHPGETGQQLTAT